jgi:phenylacetate-CoA ligase
VGLVATPGESLALTGRLASEGALRMVALGEMAGGEIDDPHDGSYDLSQLVNFVVTRVSLPAAVAPLDLLTEEERASLINERLRDLLDEARKAPLYAERLRGLDITAVGDLEKLPVLTREEMDQNMLPKGRGLAASPEYWGGYVSRSGGSTGEPKFAIYDGPDWEAMISHAERCLRAAGLTRGDRLANFMLAGDLYGSFVSFDHINRRIGVTTFAFAHQLSPAVFVDIWRKFQINVVQGIPTAILPLLRAARELEPALRIEKVVYAGNPMAKSDFVWLREALGVKRIASIIGANDGGQLAFQCEHQSGPLHHLVDDYNYVEIIDEIGKRVPDGEPGRILLTSLQKRAFPLIRYELGDAGRIVGSECACGRTTRVIEYLGRADDTIPVGNMNFRFRDVAAALGDLPLSPLQLVVRSVPAGDAIVLRAETTERTEEMKGRILSQLFTRLEKLEERVEDKSVAELTIELLAPGELPRNPRTGKVRQLVEERL